MKAVRLSRVLHKWLGLLTGLQLLLWTISGFYMVAVPIEVIHGDMLMQNATADSAISLTEIIPIDVLLQKYPDTTSLTLTALLGKAVYRLDSYADIQLIDARTGALLPPMTKPHIMAIARQHYAGDSAIEKATLFTADPPAEVRFLQTAAWRVDFADNWGTSFYIDAQSGKFITRRHTLWRAFDFLWMLHIMDYETRDNINNPLLVTAAILGLLFFLTGAWVLYFSVGLARRRVR